MSNSAQSELVLDGRHSRCPIDGCGWWVPAGMEYMYPDHRAKHDSRLPMRYFEAKHWARWRLLRLKLWWDT